MDNDVQERLESLEELCRRTLGAVNGLQQAVSGLQQTVNGLQQTVNGLQQTVNGLRQDFEEFRQEQRAENARTHALLQQLGARVTSVEGRAGAVEEAVFGSAATTGD